MRAESYRTGVRFAGSAMFDLVFGLVVGSCIGYGVRAFISRYRRVASRRRFGLA